MSVIAFLWEKSHTKGVNMLLKPLLRALSSCMISMFQTVLLSPNYAASGWASKLWEGQEQNIKPANLAIFWQKCEYLTLKVDNKEIDYVAGLVWEVILWMFWYFIPLGEYTAFEIYCNYLKSSCPQIF